MNIFSLIFYRFTKALSLFWIIIVPLVFLSSCGGETATEKPVGQNVAPIADAGSDITAFEREKVKLVGAGIDSDGTVVSYRWTIEGHNNVALDNSNLSFASFISPETDEVLDLRATLTVTDNNGATHSDVTTIRILPEAIAEWQPSKISDCIADKNVSPVADSIAGILTSEGERVWEPSIIFSDETTTLFIKAAPGPKSLVSEILTYSGIAVADGDSNNLVFDDGTHGDSVAGDGVFTRACLYIPSPFFEDKEAIEILNLFAVSDQFRDTEKVTEIAPNVRVNSAGFFISVGDEYQQRATNNWQLVGPETCQACAIAWQLSGDIFDFFSVATRDPFGGAGYIRVHDHIKGTGFSPPCADNSYCYQIVDGQAHLKLIGIIWNGWPGLEAYNHEIGHGLLGLGTRDFPSFGDGTWNSDMMHLDSDTTVNGELSGPFWDPERGWPYAVVLEDESGQRNETYLIKDANGEFRMKPLDESFSVWSNILLYMMGLLDSSQDNDVYYKLVKPKVYDCNPVEYQLVCRNDLVTSENVISFTTNDLIARYGSWSAPAFYEPEKLTIGVLNITDRQHTNAEIVWLTRVNREFSGTVLPDKPWFKGTSWHKATRGLSKVDVNALRFTQTGI